jgi:hypothetical protein
MNKKNRKLITSMICGLLLLMSVTWVGNTVSDSQEHDTDTDFEDGILENVELMGTGSDAYMRLKLSEGGGYATGFDFDGIINIDPSTNFDVAYDVAKDLRHIYIVGYDRSPGDQQWRIEKRDKTNGELITTFDTDGVVESNPSSFTESPRSIAIDSNYIYVAGTDFFPGNDQWRIEKRDKITGALVSAFNGTGIVQSNPGSESDIAYSIAVDSRYLYIAGITKLDATDAQYRVEKRDKSTGEMITTFGSNGVVEWNPSTGFDYAQDIVVDSNYIYLAVNDYVSNNYKWRVYKYDKNTGELVSDFDGNGILMINPSAGDEHIFSLKVDSNYLYLAGTDNSPGNLQWRVEKRDKVTGALITGFNTTGVVLSNPSSGVDYPYSIAIDSDHIYVTGYDISPGNLQWRVEKRDISTGVLVTTFDTDGVVESNPSSGNDISYSIAIDSSNIYIVGYDRSPGLAQWRVEKRDKSTGALAVGFNETGVIKSNPSISTDNARSIAQDSNYIYVAGTDYSPGNIQWRVEKRDKTTGALVTSFDSDGIVESNPSTSIDEAYSLTVDSNYIYIAGVDMSPGNLQWRIEKRDKTTGALVTGFNSTGVVQSNPSSFNDYARSIVIDSNYIYVAGWDFSPGGSDAQWRVEKRYKSNGSLVNAFDSDGVVESNPSGSFDFAYSIIIDSDYIYTAGTETSGSYRWRIEKRDKTTGTLANEFDFDGVIVSNPSTGSDYAQSITLDSEYIYIAGFDSSQSSRQWRIEKHYKNNGSLVNTFDSDGVVESHPSDGTDTPYSITVDSNYIYVAGYDVSPWIAAQWRIEKRDKTTGALVTSFDNDGVIQRNPSIGDDIAYSIVVDSNYIYVVGFDTSPGNREWRIEKYTNRLYPENGIYTSPINDASGADNVIWSTISWDSEVLPPETMVKFQLAACDDGVTWEYLGPDGTEDTYYETAAGQRIWSGMSGRYMRYKAYFSTTNTSSTPTLDDVKITYLEVEPPSVTLSSPNGGEDWMRNKWYPITWNAEGEFNSTPVCLYYSLDNGASWITIINNTENSGHYNWTIPDYETANALIKVTVTDISNEAATDTSDASFAIDPPPPGAGGVPDGGGGSQFPPDEQPGAGEEPTGDSGNSRAPKGLEPGLVAGVIALLISIIIILILTIFFVTRSKRSKNFVTRSKRSKNQDNKEINQKVRSKISIENLKDKGESR